MAAAPNTDVPSHGADDARSPSTSGSRLRRFLHDFSGLMGQAPEEDQILLKGGRLLSRLVAFDDWLAPPFATADPEHYRQYLLHCDGAERFSVVAFVWGPGQSTPVHNHTVWGLVGVLRGAELAQPFARIRGRLTALGPEQRLAPGQVTAVSPTVGDLHRVANAYADRPTVSIHVYGGNIGRIRRTTYDEAGKPKLFVSGYSNDVLPNPWRGD
jgi:predicted metal-dependent enzyme (double-stranded beta helix superfamily)